MDNFMAFFVKKFVKKTVSFILIFALIFGQISAPILVLADEVLVSEPNSSIAPEPTISPDPSPTLTVTPTSAPEPTPTDSLEPIAPTLSPNPTPIESEPIATESATPIPEPSLTPIASPSAQPTITESTEAIPQTERPTLKQMSNSGPNNSNKKKNINKQKKYVEGEVLVKFKKSKIDLKKDAGKSRAKALAQRHGSVEIKDIKDSNIEVLDSDKTTQGMIDELQKDPDVEVVEPNYVRMPSTTIPNDPSFGQQWGLLNTGQNVNGKAGLANADISATKAWDLEQSNQPDVVVAVIDTGVTYDHPDLAANMWDGTSCKDDLGNTILAGCPNHGWDYQYNDNDPYDNAGHGSHVSGIIAGAANNGVGITGLSNKNHLKIMAIKVGDWHGFYSSAIIEAINFAKNNGAKVINASYGGGGYSQLEKDTMASFPGLFIAAAGNSHSDNDNTPTYPSSYDLPNVIAVAATDQNDNLASFSSYGHSTVDVGAPGVNILSSVGFLIENINEEKDFQNFENVTPPAIPNDYAKTGDWGTKIVGEQSGSSQVSGGGLGKALYGDVNNFPYKNNSNDTLSSPKFDMANYENVLIGLTSRCDTQYEAAYTDYMVLEASKDGQNYDYVSKWDEWDLDTKNGDTAHNPVGYAQAELTYQLPKAYATKDFRYRLTWHTDGSKTGDLGLGCLVDNISISGIKQGGSKASYEYWDGTSMATPHVAGEAGMIMSYKPSLTTAQVKEAILNSGDPISALAGKTVTGKRINLYNAMQSLVSIGKNANLATLILSQGLLTPSFLPSITSYSAIVAQNISSITVTPIAQEAKTTIKVNDVSVASGQVSQPINLNVGVNIITIVITAENGDTKTYVVNVTKVPDTVAPAIVITRDPDKNIHNGTYTLTVDFDDAITKTYKVDDGSLIEYKEPVIISSEGQHTFYAEGIDSAGNKGTAQVSFTIDKTAPIVTISRKPDQDFSNSSYVLSVDYGNSDISQYKINNGEWTSYVGDVTINDEGSYVFLARGMDLAGNITLVQTNFTVDKTAPVVTIDYPFENSRVSETTAVSYGISNGSKLECSVDSIVWSDCFSAGVGSIKMLGGGSTVILGEVKGFDLLPEGKFTFSIRLTDEAGNAGTASRNFIKDTHIPSAPGTPMTNIGPFINSSEYNNGFTIKVPLQSDAKPNHLIETYLNGDMLLTSELLTEQNIKDGYYSFIVGANKLFEDGIKIFTAKITDDLGRSSKLSNSLVLVLDTIAPQAPVITSIASDNKINTSEKKTVAVKGNAEANSLVTVALTDDKTAISTSLVLGTNETDYSVALDANNLKDGNITASVSAQDEAGNISDYAFNQALMDTVAPSITYASIKSDNLNPKMAKVGDMVTVTFITSEPLDEKLSNIGINELIPTLIKNSDFSYSASRKILAQDPEQEIEFDIDYFDLAGNRGTVVASTTDGSSVTVDNTAPQIFGVENNKFYNKDIVPTFNEGSGLLNGNTFGSGTTILKDGVYSLIVTDQAGNSTTVNFNIDKTAPVLSINRIPNIDVANTDYTLAIEYFDTNLKSKEYGIDNKNWIDYKDPITITTEGNHIFEAKLTDLAGNVTQKQVNFRINKTVPLVAKDSYSTIINTPITVDSSSLLSNDKDLGEDTLSIINYTNVVNGQIEISGTKITFLPTDGFVGTGSYDYVVSDGLNTAQATVYIVVTPVVNNNQTPIQPIVDLSKENNQVIVVNTSFDSVINVPSNVTNATLNLSNLTSSTATQTTATITGNINSNSSTSNGDLGLQLPQGLTISAPSGWNGTVNMPTLLNNSSVNTTTIGANTTTTSVVEVGFGDTKLMLSKAARIVIPGKKGQLAGYSQVGQFTPITTTCTSDDQVSADQLLNGADCKIDVGSDLVIWTKHFTKFVTYTENSQETSDNSSSGNSSSSSSSSSNNNPNVCNDNNPGSAPKLLSAVVTGQNEITLIWSKASDPVTYYLIAYGTESGKIKYGNPNVGDKNTTRYVVRGLSGGSTYYFKIRAGNNCMPGKFSDELQAVASGSKIGAIAKDFNVGALSKQAPRTQNISFKSHAEFSIFNKVINFIFSIFNHK